MIPNHPTYLPPTRTTLDLDLDLDRNRNPTSYLDSIRPESGSISFSFRGSGLGSSLNHIRSSSQSQAAHAGTVYNSNYPPGRPPPPPPPHGTSITPTPMHLTSPPPSRLHRQPSSSTPSLGGPGYNPPPVPTSTSASSTTTTTTTHPPSTIQLQPNGQTRSFSYAQRPPSSVQPPTISSVSTSLGGSLSAGQHRLQGFPSEGQGGRGYLSGLGQVVSSSSSSSPSTPTVTTTPAPPYPFSLTPFAQEGPSASSSSPISPHNAGVIRINGQPTGQAGPSSSSSSSSSVGAAAAAAGRILGYTGGQVGMTPRQAGYGSVGTGGNDLMINVIPHTHPHPHPHPHPTELPLNGSRLSEFNRGSTEVSLVEVGRNTPTPAQLVPSSTPTPTPTSNQGQPGASASTMTTTAMTPNPDPPPSKQPSQKRRKQHASRGGSVASATSTGSRGSGSTSENVPRVGGVRCYWAMLKPRYPISECEVPQLNSGSTPSSTSSPHNVGPNAPAPTRPFPALSTSTSSTTPPQLSTIEPAPKPKRKRFELDFVHLDPVLSVHMRMQSMSMLGRGVIEFIHPEEREQARKDLYSSTRVNNLEGSVTRVRFARLSRIRTILGCPPEDEDIPSDAYKFVEDDEYLIVDLSLHWACDGLILAFFHAIKDKDKETNNDPKLRHQEWSNYCGTPGFTDEDVEFMWDDVGKALTTQSLNGPTPPPDRVFLIHATEESAVRPDSVIFAWPPPRIRKQYKVDMDEKVIKLLGDDAWATNPEEDDEDELDAYGRRRSEVVPRMDGKYWAQDYAELMKHVELENKTGRPDAWGTFGKTSCTQRFQGGHILTNEGVWRKIESVFIPYGKITFACFQTVQVLPIDTIQRDGIPSIVVQEGQPHGSLPWMPGPWPKPDMTALQAVSELPHLATFASGPSPMPSHLQLGPTLDTSLGETKKSIEVGFPLLSHSTSQTVKPQSSRLTPPPPPSIDLNGAPMSSAMTYGMSAPPMYAPQGYNASVTMEMPNATNTYSVNPLSAASYTSMDGIVAPPQAMPINVSDWNPPPAPLNRSNLDPYLADLRGTKRKAFDDEDLKMGFGYMGQPSVLSYPPTLNGIPRMGLQYPADGAHQDVLSGGIQVELPASDSNADTPDSDRKKKLVDKEPLRPAVPPPEGIECCIQCATTESPEWRKSVSGIKNLCNACGLKLARLQAKREGRQKPRKKKPISSSPIAGDYAAGSTIGGGFDSHYSPGPSGLGNNGQSWSGGNM